MKNLFDVFRTALEKLDQASIPYMVVGSVASIVYGEPRMTKDMDVVINVRPEDASKFETLFPLSDYYCPPREVLIDECLNRGQFNLLHPASGLKIDIIVMKNNPHSLEEFKRRSKISLWDGFEAYVAAPEDVIIKKLLYYQEGRSEKHLTDIKGILSQTPIDKNYLERWIKTLRLEEFWSKI